MAILTFEICKSLRELPVGYGSSCQFTPHLCPQARLNQSRILIGAGVIQTVILITGRLCLLLSSIVSVVEEAYH